MRGPSHSPPRSPFSRSTRCSTSPSPTTSTPSSRTAWALRGAPSSASTHSAARARELPPPPPDDEAEDPALDSLLRSLLEGEEGGPGGAAVRAGALGVLPLTPGHARLLEVLAAAHVRSGAPLFCSLPAGGAAGADAAEASGAAAVASLDALSAAGVDMRRVIVAHAQSLLGAPAALRALLATGARR
mmetsp:Transcript_41658/g.135091  ORF Transcript_41658/g.135091 Transcript_41658/m.135091 type:complete len:187 (-) Transcript_41658:270-830(-)